MPASHELRLSSYSLLLFNFHGTETEGQCVRVLATRYVPPTGTILASSRSAICFKVTSTIAIVIGFSAERRNVAENLSPSSTIAGNMLLQQREEYGLISRPQMGPLYTSPSTKETHISAFERDSASAVHKG
ncbi:hypothetical protein FA13DRAFT_1463671 [Coprinellus micaceus]|uniref:Uncharacterized protein n=1 Tax=Coprinellus micaceus TaxID=71717 RepID=A0A4Y7SLY9_COPMI|nr:hypothetical protein FA13DRAFT_1463671 [Coprinellus micaceus]